MSTSPEKHNMYSAPVPGMEEEQDLFTNFENAFPNDTQEQEDEGDDSWNVAAFAKISVVSQQDTSRADTSCTEFSPSLFDSMEEHEDEEEGDDELDESVGTERSEPPAIMTPDPSFNESEKGKDDKDQEVPNIPESYSFSSEASSSESSSSSSESHSLSEDENEEETFESEENRDKETPEDTEGSEELTETLTSAVEVAPESNVEQDQESVPNVVRVESSSSSDDNEDDDDESAAKSTRSARSLRSLLSRKSNGSRKSAGSKSSNKSHSLLASLNPIRALFGKKNKSTTSSAKSDSVQTPVENKSARDVPNSNEEDTGAPVENITTSTPNEAPRKEKRMMKIRSVLKGLGIKGGSWDDDVVAPKSRRATRFYKIRRKKPKTEEEQELSFLEEFADEFFTCSYFFKCVGDSVAEQGRDCGGGCCFCGGAEEADECLQIDSGKDTEITCPENENPPEPVGYFSSWSSYIYGQA